MNMEVLRKAVHARPFKPFTIYLADGRRLVVTHPDFVAMSSTGRDATIYAAGEKAADQIDMLLVTRISFRTASLKRRPA
jgi:hypothetical protein